VLGTLEDAHVDAQLGDEHGRDDAIDTGDSGQASMLFAIRFGFSVPSASGPAPMKSGS